MFEAQGPEAAKGLYKPWDLKLGQHPLIGNQIASVLK